MIDTNISSFEQTVITLNFCVGLYGLFVAANVSNLPFQTLKQDQCGCLVLYHFAVL